MSDSDKPGETDGLDSPWYGSTPHKENKEKREEDCFDTEESLDALWAAVDRPASPSSTPKAPRSTPKPPRSTPKPPRSNRATRLRNALTQDTGSTESSRGAAVQSLAVVQSPAARAPALPTTAWVVARDVTTKNKADADSNLSVAARNEWEVLTVARDNETRILQQVVRNVALLQRASSMSC